MSNRFLRKKNVVGYGLGIKRVNGKKTGEEAMLFFVEKKTDDISEKDRVPDAVDGIKTDVIETGKISPLLLEPCDVANYSKTIVPLRGGLTISGSATTAGTLGAIVKDSVTGKLLAMTNSHVAGNPIDCSSAQAATLTADGVEFIQGTTAAGLEMYQPYTTDGNQFGSVYKDYRKSFNYINRLDVSLMNIKSEYGVTPGIMGLTKYAQPFVHPNTVPVGTAVLKSGRTSGVTYGDILSINATVSVSYGTQSMAFEHQIIVESEDTETGFVESGDSGSALAIDLEDGRVGLIGLLHSGTDPDSAGSIAVATRLDDIVALLGVAPWRGEIITANTYPDVVSTAFGAVFQKDSTTFLSVTNDYVCDGTVCGLGDLEVRDCEHQVRSLYLLNSDITLDVNITNNDAQCDAEVTVEVTMTSETGATMDADVTVRVSTDIEVTQTHVAELDVVVGGIITLDAEATVYANTTAQMDTVVYATVTPDMVVHTGGEAELDVTVYVGVDMDTTASVVSVSDAELDAIIQVTVTPDMTATVPDLDFGSPGQTVGVCDSTDYDPLGYEVAL